ncbi:MAG: hypothetical protein ACRD2C_20935 [Acidimicrobiales bacterium]
MTTTDGPAPATPSAGLSSSEGGASPALPALVNVRAAPIGAEPAVGHSDEAPPGGPSLGRVRRASRILRVGGSRAPGRPFFLRLGMALACLPLLAFATAVHVGVERNESTVTTVGSEATRGITVAQALKLKLAELDEVVVRSLLSDAPLTENGFPDEYNTKRAELHESLVLAALVSSSGAAYEQPLVNIDYAVSHYHDLVQAAFAARRDGDGTRALEAYGQAHQVMAETLLPEADFVDKANSYVLNNTYDGQTARSASTERLIVMSWIALLAFLVLVQILVVWRFRRLINLGLALATVIALATGAFTLNRLDASSSHLADAREQAFESVHVLARARATVVSARQAQGQFLLDPATADGDQVDFEGQVSRLLRMEGEDVVELAVNGTVPEGAAGYLARVAGPDAPSSDPEGAREVVLAFGGFLTEDAAMRRLVATNQTEAAMENYTDGRAYTGLDAAITAVQANEQETFDEAADAAGDAAAPLDELNFLAAPGILLLALLGLFQRLREYRT